MSKDQNSKEFEKCVKIETYYRMVSGLDVNKVVISQHDWFKAVKNITLIKPTKISKEEQEAFERAKKYYGSLRVKWPMIPIEPQEEVKIKHPPQYAEFFLSIFLNKDEREYVVGDLEEKFYRWVEKRGIWRARALYWVDSLSMIQPRLSSLFYSLLKFLMKIGLLAWITKLGGPTWLIDVLQKIVK